jgi:RHS repeat-associated protein
LKNFLQRIATADTRIASFVLFLFSACFWLLLFAQPIQAATFSGNASIAVPTDPAQSLTSTSGVFTVSCWFKLYVPSSLTVNENLTIAMDRADGNESAPYSYLLRINASNGALEFLTRDATTTTTLSLLNGLYVNRWYHVAVVRDRTVITAYIDGKKVAETGVVSSSTAGNGLAIGGFTGSSRLFYGDIIEFALYTLPLSLDEIRFAMFRDQSGPQELAAYYKLDYSTNTNDWYRNFATVPGPDTDLATKVGTGTISFEEVDQAGEQSLFDSRLNGGRDAIVPLSGVFAWQRSALTRPVPGIAFDFKYGYSSALPPRPTEDLDPYHKRTLGDGWRHAFDARVISYIFNDTEEEIKIMSWDGSIETWVRTDSEQQFQTRHREYRGEVVRLLNNKIEWTTPERLTYVFRPPGTTIMSGRLLEVRDPNGNKLQLFWNQDAVLGGYVTNAIDSAGGRYVFNYDAGFLTNITFGSWQVNFSFTNNRLASQSFTNTSGAYSNLATTWHFYYNATNNLLERIVDPRGPTNIVVRYDRFKRRIGITDALNRTDTFEYGNPDSRSIRITDADCFSSTNTFDRKGRIVAETDPLGNTTRYTYNDLGQQTSITEPLGWVTLFDYDTRGNMIARTNALGDVTRWTYHTNFNRVTSEVNARGWTNSFVIDNQTGNLMSQYDVLGLIITNSYSTNGLLLTSTDARGYTTRFSYNGDGFLVATTDPATNTTTFAVNDLGWRLAQTNALNQVTTFAYDLIGNVVRTVDPLFRVFTRVFDGDGNLTAESDAKGLLTSYAYDPANQRTNMVDRTGTNIWVYIYNRRGSLERTINPLGHSSTNFYDNANHLVRAAGPLGSSIRYEYDANGNRTNLIDQLGRSWRTRYDELNRVIAEIDPQGDVRITEYDELGRVKKAISPRGYASVNEYDGRGRLVHWTDPENQLWQYDYDAVGNITNITDAPNGHYVMTYGPRNERVSERNQDGKEWRYQYDTLLRVWQQTDPNGLIRVTYYDEAGRVDYVEFSTGRTDNYEFDVNNNLTTLTRQKSGQPPANSVFTYDLLDRLETQTHAFSKQIRYEYDALSRRSKLIYPDNKTLTYEYDALNRMTNQMDWSGRQMTYGYDLVGRVVRHTYPNNVVQTNLYDESGQLTNLTYTVANKASAAINVALEYAYDRNGNTIGGSRTGTLDWPLPSLTDEGARYTPSGRLIDRKIVNATSNTVSAINYSYDSSGNMTNALGNGQTWALTYDEDNRVTRIAWDSGLTSKIISNRYDALGRRIAKIVDGSQTGYVLDLGGGMERILCDLNASSQITAYYVHGPGLSYKVIPGILETVICYHADAQANVIALTRTGGTNSAQYAYTPYGRSIASTNGQEQLSEITDNPYRFVGSQGVMEELPSLYFMRARYYSAEAGVFLSTDPIKPIGPGWQPIAYEYANGNPLSTIDPAGTSWFVVAKLAYDALNMSLKWSHHASEGSLSWKDVTRPAIGVAIGASSKVATIAGYAGAAAELSTAGWLYFAYGQMEDWNNHEGVMGAVQREILWNYLHTAYPEAEIVSVKDGFIVNHPYDPNHPPDSFSLVSAADYATDLNNQNASNGSQGNNSGGSTVNPLVEALQGKASRAKHAAGKYSKLADESYTVYRQATSQYGQLIGMFENTDYFTYFLAAQQPKLMAEQAYSQYKYYKHEAREAMDRYNAYKQALKQVQN